MAAKSKKNTEVTTDRTERQKALDMALAQIEKQYGKGSVMRLGENIKMNVDAVPTGSMALDAALGIGGLPRGRIIEVYGPEFSCFSVSFIFLPCPIYSSSSMLSASTIRR